jgi:hypothetical protein
MSTHLKFLNAFVPSLIQCPFASSKKATCTTRVVGQTPPHGKASRRVTIPLCAIVRRIQRYQYTEATFATTGYEYRNEDEGGSFTAARTVSTSTPSSTAFSKYATTSHESWQWKSDESPTHSTPSTKWRCSPPATSSANAEYATTSSA